jgi:hypothetical protein
MVDTKYKVSVKYITKNIITDGKEFFLAATNQISAKTMSSRNFKTIESRVCIV